MSKLTATDMENLTMEQATGSDTALVVAVNDWKEYDENRKPSKVIGTRYTSLATKKRHKEFVVKVQAPPIFTQEQLDEAGGILVRFKGFAGKFYNATDGTCPISATATAVEVIAMKN